MRIFARVVLGMVLAAGAALLSMPRTASAHPMGNFSINQYSALTVGQDKVALRYIVDMAEIPTFQELATIRPDRSADLTLAERDRYIASKSAELVQGLALSVDGRPLALKLDDAELTFPPGNGGLPTLRLEMSLSASLAGATRGTLEYSNTNFSEHAGWKEIIAAPASGTAFERSTVPWTDRTRALTIYNSDAVSSPLDVSQATVVFKHSAPVAEQSQTGVATEQAESQGAVAWAQQRIDEVASIIAQDDLPLGTLLIGLFVAFFWGAGHALSPGHGKTVVAAYLVGTRGTARHAALLGLTVTISHTVGVFALGLVVLLADDYIVPGALYPVLGFTSGLLILGLGLVMFIQRWRNWRGQARSEETLPERDGEHAQLHERGVAHSHSHDHTHSHAHEHEAHHHHDHQHDHEHESVPHKHGMFGRPHTHLPASSEDSRRVTVGSLLALGISGGIIPCPTALVVLLASIAYHRLELGLAWILAFSLGLASVLTGLGLLVVYGKDLLGRGRLRAPGGRLLVRLPMASSLVMATLGLVIALQSLQIR